MRIFTCTPVEFGGGADFFARDSGLLCRGFQSLGVDSRAVMPGVRNPEDEEDLIRTDYHNLESVDWWRSMNVDGVVLYAWGRPKFRKGAAAIRGAGIFLVLNQDNGGLVSPLAGARGWLEEQWIMSGQGRGIQHWLGFLKIAARGLTAGLLITDPLRAVHLRHGDVIACVSPKAAEHYRKLCHICGGNSLASRVTVIPHAVETRFRYHGSGKLRQVACIGRWSDAVQKRPGLLMDVVTRLLAEDPTVKVVIAGMPSLEMRNWHAGLADGSRQRVNLCGMMGRGELAGVLACSQVFYSPSAYESFGIAAAEALSSGCSVVAGKSVSMASFEWFVSENSGTLSDDDTVQGHLDALKAELTAWEDGGRDAFKISERWSEQLHADKVAGRILRLIRHRDETTII